MHYRAEYLTYVIHQKDKSDPFSVLKESGNLLNHFETEQAARRAIREDRIRELATEIVNITGLRD